MQLLLSRSCALRTAHNVNIIFISVLYMLQIFSWNRMCILIWTALSEFGTYRLSEQRRFRRACASAQSRQNLRCSLIQAVSQEEPSDRKPYPWPLWMAGHAQLKFVMTECSKTQIRLTGHIWCSATWLRRAFCDPRTRNPCKTKLTEQSVTWFVSILYHCELIFAFLFDCHGN